MYPKICTSRNDSRQQVVVANAEQEAALPEEFQPLSGSTSTTGGFADVLLSPEYAALKADQAQLAADKLALEEERAALTAGYQESMAELDADRAALKAEREEFEASKSAATAKRTAKAE